MQYQDKKVTVIGLGKTGLSCVDFLRAKHADVRVIDTRNAPAGAEQLDKAIPLHTGSLNQQWLLESDLIVISPGLAVKTPEIQTALQAGVEVVGDIELFCREANKPIVAITGSNGKSTVTTLVAEMAKAAGLSVGMGGNIGIPALSLLNQSHDIYVLELPVRNHLFTKNCGGNGVERHRRSYESLRGFTGLSPCEIKNLRQLPNGGS